MMREWNAKKDAIHAVEVPDQDNPDGCTTISDVVNEFLDSKEALIEADKLTKLTLDEYVLGRQPRHAQHPLGVNRAMAVPEHVRRHPGNVGATVLLVGDEIRAVRFGDQVAADVHIDLFGTPPRFWIGILARVKRFVKSMSYCSFNKRR